MRSSSLSTSFLALNPRDMHGYSTINLMEQSAYFLAIAMAGIHLSGQIRTQQQIPPPIVNETGMWDNYPFATTLQSRFLRSLTF